VALPDIIIESPFILATLSASPTGIIPQKAGFEIAFVQMVNQLSTKVTVGQYVMLDKNDARAFLYGSTIYYLVDENNLLFQENPAP
jgi:hypothetical protein